MTRRTRTTIVTAAASLMFSGFTMAQSGVQGPAGQRNTPSMRPGGASDMNAGAIRSGDMNGSGQQAEEQILQTLRKISQDPSTAAAKLFVLKAACGNMMEAQLASAVQAKVQNQQVKQLAQQLEQDHQQANQQLKSVAQSMQIELPTSLDQQSQQEIQILTSLPADQLEKQYVAMMQADHVKDITMYRNVSQMAQNDQVKQYAQQTLPKLQQHLQHVQQCATALGIPANIPGEAQTAGSRMEGSGGMRSGSMDGSSTGGSMGGSSSGNPASGTGNPGRTGGTNGNGVGTSR